MNKPKNSGTFSQAVVAATGLRGARVKLTHISTKGTRMKRCLPGGQAVLLLSTLGHPDRQALTDFCAPSCHWAHGDSGPEARQGGDLAEVPQGLSGREERLITC